MTGILLDHSLPSDIPNGTSAVDQQQKPATKPKGIIYPPPEIKNVVDKTASFVARFGAQFEDHVRENERGNPKFSFLNENDPYHAYFQYRIQEAREGKNITKAVDEKDVDGELVVEEKKPPKEPPAFEFMVEMPNLSAQDLDIIKLTAQFVARNGTQFMNALSRRESRNYQFDFMRPSHSLFPYFNKLVGQYRNVLMPPKGIFDKCKTLADDKHKIYERVLERVEYAAWQREEKKKQEEIEDAERQAFAQIDWHDFVVVETIEFTDADENMELPVPMLLADLERMTLAEKQMSLLRMSIPEQASAPADGRGKEVVEEEMDMEEDEVDMEEEDEEEDEEAKKPTPAVQIKPPEQIGPIKIRKDYVPKAKKPAINEPKSICPRCGEAFPASELEEHMRIELLDPKWREQKQAAEAKKKESNLLLSGSMVERNIKQLSSYRADIFGSEDDTTIQHKLREEEERRKKIERSKVVWDGHTATINLAKERATQGVTMEDQISALHRSKGLTGESDIGPRIPAPEDEHATKRQKTG
ncbi:uncharacterized protein VTP21DRAFT_5588 [Calcarisporiella thermophila]|uniref:uncharacterized protein n=1 Tax=Calcarisporiella thermophila TaxID=911321 RepID=UPI0037430E19